jgi:hypothetical protein
MAILGKLQGITMPKAEPTDGQKKVLPEFQTKTNCFVLLFLFGTKKIK